LTLTAAEVSRLAQAIDAQYRTLIYVAAWTGLRSGELWALRHGDVDLARGVLHVRHTVKAERATATTPPHARDAYGREVGPPKNGKPRSISLPKHLRAMLAEHLLAQPTTPGGASPTALVFRNQHGGPVRHPAFMRLAFKPAVAAALPAEKQALRFHDLRHTCATLLINAGAPGKLVQERLGHASIATTLNLYGHVLPSTEAALVAQMDALYESTAEA
jgi:integrase